MSLARKLRGYDFRGQKSVYDKMRYVDDRNIDKVVIYITKIMISIQRLWQDS